MRAQAAGPAPAVADPYPTRRDDQPRVCERVDPVVYARDRAGCPLTTAQVRRYARDGFITLEQCFDAGEVALLNAERARLHDDAAGIPAETLVREPGGAALRSIFAVHRASPVFARLATDARLVDIARWLLGDAVYVHQSRLNYKPGLHGREFWWHSDFETWHAEDGMPRMRALSMSIALSENTVFNGPLLLVRGSHRTFVGCVGETPPEHFRTSLRQQHYGTPDEASLRRLVGTAGLVAATGAPGSVTIFDCNVLHGSNGNITPFDRSNAFIVYNAVGNALQAPYCGRAPRPEFIAARTDLHALVPATGPLHA